MSTTRKRIRNYAPLSPITSTYPLPFFFAPFFAPAPPAPSFLLLGTGGPSKSSILLALLMPVPGLLGGPLLLRLPFD